MTHDNNNEMSPLPDALRWELRALRRDVAPETDLWPSIAHRISATKQTPRTPTFARPAWRRFAPIATAATLALAIGIAWQVRPVQAPGGAPAANDPHARLIVREAEAMTLEYQAALKELDGGAPERPARNAPALQVLDRSAAQIRTALSRDPDARFLLDRLQSTYNRRLELTQRLSASASRAS